MPRFQYKAVTSDGTVEEGVLESASQAGVVTHLQSLGRIPMRAVEVGASGDVKISAPSASGDSTPALFGARSIGPTELALITRELATLLKAGLPLDRSLEILIGLADKPRLAKLLTAIRNELRGGSALSKALDQHREVFSRFYINMVRAGEAGGALGSVLVRLADYLERAKELKDNVVSALIYPTILLLVATSSVLILVVFVVPQFKQIFDQSGKALPLATDVVLTTGLFLRHYWPLIVAALLVLVGLLRRSLIKPVSRARWDARFLHWPLVGGLVARVEMARFSRSLGTLLQNGVPLLTGLSILKDTLGNAVFRDAVEVVARELKEGRGMAKPMLETQVFPKLAVQMISVGEETGQLESMLFQVADVYDREVAAAVKRAMALLEPVMIVGLALLIGGIIMSILVAMFDLMDLPF